MVPNTYYTADFPICLDRWFSSETVKPVDGPEVTSISLGKTYTFGSFLPPVGQFVLTNGFLERL